MKLKTIALMGICASMALVSCSKDDDGDKKDDDSTSSIVGTWRISAQTVTMSFGGQDTTWDEYAQLEACEKDNMIRLGADKTATDLSGPIKCDPNEPESAPAGTYEMLNNNTKIRMMDSGDTSEADIITLNTTTLSIKTSENSRGVTYSSQLTFKRQ